MKKHPLIKHDPRLLELIKTTNQKILAIWALDCVEKHMYLIEDKYPFELRPRESLNILKKWLNDEISMWDARKYTWPTLAAARELESTDKAACMIARACSHTLATCHVPTHAEGSAIYVCAAIYYLNQKKENVLSLVEEERKWQIKHLIDLSKPN